MDSLSPFDRSHLRRCGEDVFIAPTVEIRRPQLVSIGSHVAIDAGFHCGVTMQVGDYVHIAPYVTVIGTSDSHLTLGDFASLAAGCKVVCATDEHLGYGLPGPTIPPLQRDRIVNAPVVLEEFANVGASVVIMPGVTLAQGTVIGACSLVRESTEPWTVYVGIPARALKKRPKEKMLSHARALGYEFTAR